ncbi:FAD-dependent oxidoreductase [Rhizorhabdus sp.]|uniref:FAD-dependent oxidoreductase n=1 Tax=Rhizorhabdus sp. TaxID=1968843 RepID=UPI00199A5304|nr:FAD-dependent oxidoreductase [Rhizorhabdus sp.]MBD3759595.1 FAD-dependent oxidoreductase [Rhizorhabdus sp.]
MQDSTGVLIVGGGPVGLALALDLAWRNVQAVLVEQDDREARRVHPRMDGVAPRTMEFCRRWGLVDAIERSDFPRDIPLDIVFGTSVLGLELGREPFPSKATAVPPPFSPNTGQICPQNLFDPILQEAVGRYSNATLLYRHRFISLVQDADGVISEIENLETGEKRSIRARYLVACDGAGSSVAKQLGLDAAEAELLSCSTNIFIDCPALAERTKDRRGYRYLLIDQEKMWGSMVNISGRGIWRLQLLGDDSWPTWTDDELHSMVRKAIGEDVRYEILSWVPWARRESVAPTYRRGRCFLAGDSAHQFSPTGGYGMNTGICEAVDLAWKLDANLQGWGGDTLLDSYEAERQPLALRAARQASINFKTMKELPTDARLFEPGEEGDRIREHIGEEAQIRMKTEWRAIGIHLGGIYLDSPVIACDQAEPPREHNPDVTQFVANACPGARAPHIWLDDGSSILDLFGRGFVLLDFGKGQASDATALLTAAEKVGMPMKRVDLAHATDAAAMYARRFVLVRPDGVVAWRSDVPPVDPEGLVNIVRGV